jgi:hypothetical protein
MPGPEINPSRLINGFPAIAYQDLLVEAFAGEYPLDPSEPVMGDPENVELAPDLLTFLNDESVIIEGLAENGRLIGCSVAVSIEKFAPERSDEAGEAVYIYFTAVHPDLQRHGRVWPLIQMMDQRLIEAGYKFVERDSDRESGYADKIEQHYRDAIVERRDHNGYSDTGAERFFRIALGRVALEEPK